MRETKNWDWKISGRSWPFGRACSKKIILTRDSHLYQPEWSFWPAEDNLNWSRTRRRIPLSATSSWVCTSSRLQLTSSEFWSGPFTFLYLSWIKTIGITSASIMAKLIKIPINWPPLNFDQDPLLRVINILFAKYITVLTNFGQGPNSLLWGRWESFRTSTAGSNQEWLKSPPLSLLWILTCPLSSNPSNTCNSRIVFLIMKYSKDKISSWEFAPFADLYF